MSCQKLRIRILIRYFHVNAGVVTRVPRLNAHVNRNIPYSHPRCTLFVRRAPSAGKVRQHPYLDTRVGRIDDSIQIPRRKRHKAECWYQYDGCSLPITADIHAHLITTLHRASALANLDPAALPPTPCANPNSVLDIPVMR